MTPPVSRALAAALGSTNAWTRERTVIALATVGGNAATATALIKALREPALRDDACEALGKSRQRKAIPFLRMLLGDENDLVRSEALTALARLAAPLRIGTIVASLSDPSPFVRVSAVFFLRLLCRRERIARARLSRLLRQHLLTETDAMVRCDALEVLHLLGDPSAHRSLLKLASSAPPPARWRIYDTVAGLANCRNYHSVLRWLHQRRRAERKPGIRQFLENQIRAVSDRFAPATL